jgi:hypothetical protein
MEIVGDYHQNGYAHVRELISPEVARAFVAKLKTDTGPDALPVSKMKDYPNLLARPAFEVYGHFYPPMQFFLWGLTPTVSQIVGRELLPTYDDLRIYREGDICRVHYDRPSCEHSLSLTLDYSDGAVWPLEIGTEESQPSARVEENFGAERFSSIEMQIGDAVLYRGVNHRHGRTQPNPNGWSVHLFLHWVDRDGPYKDQAFDGQLTPAAVNFQFA